MRLLSWNIRQGGGKRTAAIIDAISAHDPDVVVLSEFRTKPGIAIQAGLRALGWTYCESTRPQAAENGICVVARTPLRRIGVTNLASEHAVRWLDVDLPEHAFAVSALHIVTASPRHGERPGAAKERFWDAVLASAERRANEPFLLIGDLNTGLPYQDEAGCTFHCAAQFARLSPIGWIDAWRHFHGDAVEYTWYSRGRSGMPGKGFRLDHAHVTAPLLPRVRDCRYSQAERQAGISDHSIMIVDLE